MAEAMLDNQDFSAPVAAIMKKKTEKNVYVDLKREDRRCKLFMHVYCRGVRSASSTN